MPILVILSLGLTGSSAGKRRAIWEGAETMPVLQATWEYSSGNAGWSEGLLRNGTYEDVLAEAATYTQLRMPLCGHVVTQHYTRISDVAVQKDSVISAQPVMTVGPDNTVVGNSINGFPGYIPATAAEYGPCDRPYSAILLRMQSGEKARRNMFLSGVPDSIITAKEYPVVTQAWQTAFDAWRTHVIAKWSFAGIDRTNPAIPPKRISAIVRDAGTGAWKVTTTAAHGFADGDKVSLFGTKALLPVSRVNGTWTVAPVDATSFLLALSLGDANPIWAKLGFAQKLLSVVNPITSVKIIRCVSRKRGRPFGSPVGRRSRRRA